MTRPIHGTITVALLVFFAALSASLRSQTPAAAADRVPAGLPGATPAPSQATYVGSATCGTCHRATHERWSKTRMANVVTDPKQHPETVLPDFTKPDPLLTFKLADVAFVYGTKWKQRYFTKVGDDYFPLPAQW